MFGWSHYEAVGRDLTDTIIPPVHRNVHRAGLKRFLATKQSSVLNTLIEIIGLHRDGHEFPIELAIAVLNQLEQEFERVRVHLSSGATVAKNGHTPRSETGCEAEKEVA